eukprot:1050062-Pyramimonas_sp.AAC.1
MRFARVAPAGRPRRGGRRGRERLGPAAGSGADGGPELDERLATRCSWSRRRSCAPACRSSRPAP